jgi:preprotein translocase subunit SecF
MKDFFSKYWKWIVAVVAVLVVIALVWHFWSKKADAEVVIKDDQGNNVTVSEEDKAKAKSLAAQLYNEIDGITFNFNDDVLMELAQQSNTVFALTFSEYEKAYDSSLLDDLQSEWLFGDVIDVVLNRASELNLR